MFSTVVLNIPALQLPFASVSFASTTNRHGAIRQRTDERRSVFPFADNVNLVRKKNVGITLLSFYLLIDVASSLCSLSISISLSLDEGNTTPRRILTGTCVSSHVPGRMHALWGRGRRVNRHTEVDTGGTGGREGSREDGHADSRCRGEHATAKELKSRRAAFAWAGG